MQYNIAKRNCKGHANIAGWKLLDFTLTKYYSSMYHNETTPDGYFVREDGSWTGQ